MDNELTIDIPDSIRDVFRNTPDSEIIHYINKNWRSNMSTTFKGEETVFCYNSDMSGNCTIHKKSTGESIEVYAGDILEFVANYVKDQRIAKLENMNSKEILGIE